MTTTAPDPLPADGPHTSAIPHILKPHAHVPPSKAPEFFTDGFNRFYSEDFFVQQLSSLNLTKRSFRAWCRAMQVPMIRMPDGKHYIEIYSFRTALRAISSIGQPDFMVPCSTIASGERRHYRRTLDLDFLRDNWYHIYCELLLARSESPSVLSDSIKEAAYKAATKMLSLVAQSPLDRRPAAVYRPIIPNDRPPTHPPA